MHLNPRFHQKLILGRAEMFLGSSGPILLDPNPHVLTVSGQKLQPTICVVASYDFHM